MRSNLNSCIRDRLFFSLGIIDPGLATAIAEGIPGMSCRSDDTVREIVRGARTHLSSMVKGLAGGGAEQAQLGLGHSYSRGKVKFNPARSDNMIIQAIALLDQMDGDLNTFAMRVKEWYSYHFPELRIIVKDNYMFARCAAFIQDKRTLFPPTVSHDDDQEMELEHAQEDRTDKLPGLIEIVGDDEMANTICAAAKTSMRMECSPVDMINIINFTQRMVRLAEFKKQLTLYLTEKMSIVAPNLSALIGDTVGARLISKVRYNNTIPYVYRSYYLRSIITHHTTNSHPYPHQSLSHSHSHSHSPAPKPIPNPPKHKTGRITHQPRQSPCLNRTNPRRRKSTLPRPQNQRQHPQIRTHLPLHLHRTRRRQEQRPDIPLPRQQVLHRHTDRLVLGRSHPGVRGEAQGSGGGTVEVLRDGGGAEEESGCYGGD